MEAKIIHIGTKIMIQTSSAKMCDFVDLFWVYKWIDFALEKVLSELSPPSARNPDPTKTAFSEFFFPKNAVDVSVTSSFLRSKDDSNHWNKQNEQVERSEKLFFPLLEVLSNSSEKTKLQKMVPEMAYEVFVRNVSSSLLVPFRFCCEFWPKSTNVKSAKCRKRSQRMSLSFT